MSSSADAKDSSIFVFEPSSLACTVRVTDIPSHVAVNEILSTFGALVGQVVSYKTVDPKHGTELEVQFADIAAVQFSVSESFQLRLISNLDAYRKALSLSRYSFDGMQLTITKAASPTGKSPDDRKNLYVLGIPFSLTKTEFSALFSQHGTVTHSVILATVDNSSRRRGFVVMSSHEEAKVAMKFLSRTQVKGHTLDISWAVVQRSQGFLDGGDRAMVLDSRPSSGKISPPQEEQSDPLSGPSLLALASLAPSLEPTATLLVTDLPTFLFCEEKDMYPLFCPFGRINKMNILESGPDACTSVVVEYGSPKIAQDAKENLQGQWYSGYQITAQFVCDANSFMESSGHGSRYPLNNANTNAFDAFDACRYPALLSAYSRDAFLHQTPMHNAPIKTAFSGFPKGCNLDAPAAIYPSKYHRRNPFM